MLIEMLGKDCIIYEIYLSLKLRGTLGYSLRCRSKPLQSQRQRTTGAERNLLHVAISPSPLYHPTQACGSLEVLVSGILESSVGDGRFEQDRSRKALSGSENWRLRTGQLDLLCNPLIRSRHAIALPRCIPHPWSMWSFG